MRIQFRNQKLRIGMLIVSVFSLSILLYTLSKFQDMRLLGTGALAAVNQEYCAPGDSASCAPPFAEWKFEEGSGTAVHDTSGNGYTGNWNGSGTHWASENIGNVGRFDGSSDFVKVADNEAFSPSNITLSGWIKWDGVRHSASSIQDWACIVCKGDYLTDDYEILMNRDSNSSTNIVRFYIDGKIATTWFNQGLDTSWHFMAFTYNGTTANIYFDGKLVSATAFSATIPNTAWELRIGAQAVNTYYWGGSLDTIRIYNYARTPDQITWEYNQRQTRTDTTADIQVFLHGIGKGGDSVIPKSLGNLNPKTPTRTVTLEVYDYQNQLVIMKEGSVNYVSCNDTSCTDGGYFTGTVNLGKTLPSGGYIFKVKSPGYLRTRVGQVVSEGQSIQLKDLYLTTGDINSVGDVLGDNLLNKDDYDVIRNCYSDFNLAIDCNDKQKAAADITDDGKVDALDYNLWLRDYFNHPGD